MLPPPVTVLPVDELPAFLGADTPIDYPEASRQKAYVDWRMEDDDSPIFRYVYRTVAPRRHLEFGTWKGEGTCYVLDSCEATVWTLNPPLGEKTKEGTKVYGAYRDELPELREWAERVGVVMAKDPQTDNLTFIGRKYLLRGLGNRVCQIYCDSREWDTSNYPDGFFDTCLIDGGHEPEVVMNDTRKALPLVRSGGIVMWHDFCPDEAVLGRQATAQGVMAAVGQMTAELGAFSRVCWIEPSFILIGIKG